MKSFCNCCGEEITINNIFPHSGGLEVELEDHKFRVVWPDAACIDFDVCKYCIIDEINKQDDRPKEPTYDTN